MSYVNLEEHLGAIVGSCGKERESVDIRIALDRYPDLQGFNYEGKVLLCSREVNFYADDVIIERKDNIHVIMPYIWDAGVKLYSLPAVIIVGVDNPEGFGIFPYPDWDEKLVENEFDRKIIMKVRDFLDSHKPASYL